MNNLYLHRSIKNFVEKAFASFFIVALVLTLVLVLFPWSLL